ncbi:hypothetical protein Y1Q_0004904 [Alligator mississippiensis]|uniref:Uncharacterized protein n=1 Tax=Alligator mississippiensis TaxID=8496 RepID=A0A151MY93_ALLMI|nr:hypothetical protein Y1Q_0004904 [Alligator mississippiensis]
MTLDMGLIWLLLSVLESSRADIVVTQSPGSLAQVEDAEHEEPEELNLPQHLAASAPTDTDLRDTKR